MRAIHPHHEGFAGHPGTRPYFEVFGEGEPTLVLVPANPIVHSRQWKAQVPYLARHYRVVTFDGCGNGRADRPVVPAAYTERAYVAELEAVLDATGSGPVVLVGLCHDGVWRSLLFAADQPERVAGVVAISVGVPLIAPPHAFKLEDRFDEELGTDEGWAKRNRHAWRRDYRGFVEFFFDQMFPEPHSTKQVEDCVGWGLEASLEAMLASMDAPSQLSREVVEAICRGVRAPLLIIHGDDDRCQPLGRAERLAELTGAPLVVLEGAGHLPTARHPVMVNLLIREFVDRLAGRGAQHRRAMHSPGTVGPGARSAPCSRLARWPGGSLGPMQLPGTVARALAPALTRHKDRPSTGRARSGDRLRAHGLWVASVTAPKRSTRDTGLVGRWQEIVHKSGFGACLRGCWSPATPATITTSTTAPAPIHHQ